MGDAKQLDLDFTLSSDTTYTGGAGSTVGGICTAGCTAYALDNTYSISISDTNDTGSEWTYNEPTISYGVENGIRTEKRLEAIENRLNILVPDPEKLEKFEALQKAYEHYKHLEKLCEIEEDQ